MVKVDLPGVASATTKRGGRRYYYAWRGGPRLRGEPGSPEFIASYHEAHAARVAPAKGTFAGLVATYKASKDYTGLADSTRAQWARWLDRICDHFGPLPVAAFDRLERIKPLIRRWRDTYAEKPRTADYGMQVLSRVLTFAEERGQLRDNACKSIKGLYSADRSEIIWQPADLEKLFAKASREVRQAVELAALTGLRRADLLRLSWSHIDREAHVIAIPTNKSGKKIAATVPLYDDLRDLLDTIPRRSTTVLTSSTGRPWTADGLSSSFNKTKIAAGLEGANLHFHDLRGTAATRFASAGLKPQQIAMLLGWKVETVERILSRYVNRDQVIRDLAAQLNKTEKGT